MSSSTWFQLHHRPQNSNHRAKSSKMAQLIRSLSLRLWPRSHHLCCSTSTIHHLLSSASRRRSFSAAALSPAVRTRIARGTAPEDSSGGRGDEGSDSDSDSRSSRNQRKREARRAVRWGMDLASFTNPQIKRVLSAASVDSEVFEAIMLLKRLGSDVREGKRRQFNYIGKLLRDAEPKLMDGLIQATKDGDLGRLQELSRSVTPITVDDEDEDEDSEYEEEEEDTQKHIDVATRWFDGLVGKDIEVTNEVYSLPGVEFDRQELRKLIRRVQEQRAVSSEESKQQLGAAEKSLNRFLLGLAKQMPIDEYEDYKVW